jgi:hypothetical protein
MRKPSYVVFAENIIENAGHTWETEKDLIDIAQIDVNNYTLYFACWDIINWLRS